MDVFVHPGTRGVLPREFQRGGVYVAAAYPERGVAFYQLFRLVAHGSDDGRRRRKTFEREIPAYAGGGVRAYERRFDGYRARTAERVYERAVGAPHGEQKHCRGEGFAYGRLSEFHTVAPFVKPRARSVQRDGGDVGGQADLDVVSPAAFGHTRSRSRAHCVRYRPLCHALYVAQGKESAFQAFRAHRDGGVGRKYVFPAHPADVFVEFVERARWEFGEDNPHAARRAQKHVRPCHVPHIPDKIHSAVFRSAGSIAQREQFSFQHCFRTACRGHADFHFAVEKAHNRIVPVVRAGVNAAESGVHALPYRIL